MRNNAGWNVSCSFGIQSVPQRRMCLTDVCLLMLIFKFSNFWPYKIQWPPPPWLYMAFMALMSFNLLRTQAWNNPKKKKNKGVQLMNSRQYTGKTDFDRKSSTKGKWQTQKKLKAIGRRKQCRTIPHSTRQPKEKQQEFVDRRNSPNRWATRSTTLETVQLDAGVRLWAESFREILWFSGNLKMIINVIF